MIFSLSYPANIKKPMTTDAVFISWLPRAFGFLLWKLYILCLDLLTPILKRGIASNVICHLVKKRGYEKRNTNV